MSVAAREGSSLGRLWPARRGPLPWSVIYATTALGSGAVYAGLLSALGDTWGVGSFGGSVYAFGGAFFIFLLLGIPVHAAIHRRLEPLRPRRGTDARVTLRTLLSEMASSTDLAGLVRCALETVTGDLGVGRASLLFEADETRDLVLVQTRGEPPRMGRLPSNHPLLEVLATLHAELSRATVMSHARYANVRAQFVGTFETLGAELVFPIEVQARLVGILTLGDLRSLDRSDVELLRTLAAEIGLCFVRARDVESVRGARLELERFARFLPRGVAADVLAGRLPGEGGRRRTVTVVVCDVPGFAAMTRRREPQEVIDTLESWQALAREETAKEGGTVAKLREAELVAVFGDPEPAPDHGRRAIAMAARLVRRSRSLWPEEDRTVAVRVGIASGFATVGFLDTAAGLDYFVLGQVPVTAEDLVRSAGPGEILASEATLATAGDGVRTVAVDGVHSTRVAHRVTSVDGKAP